MKNPALNKATERLTFGSDNKNILNSFKTIL